MTNVTKALKLRIYPSKEVEQKLIEVSEKFQEASNFVSEYIFKHDFILTNQVLHDRLYEKIRKNFGLMSQMAQSVIRYVIAKYKTVKTQMKKKKKTLEHLWYPIKFKIPQATFVMKKDYRFKDDDISLSIFGEKLFVDYKKDVSYQKQFFSPDNKMGEALLIRKNKKWYLHIATTMKTNEFDRKKPNNIIGIDRGMRQLVTAYDSDGKTIFYDGKKILEKRKRFKRKRQELQEKNTKSSRRRMRRIGNRENRWMEDINHQISKALVNQYGSNCLFVIEDLEDIKETTRELSKEQRNEHISWAYYDFEQKLKYKAESLGSFVLNVDSHYTSQRCPKCGLIEKKNRNKKAHIYVCKDCRYKSNDDRVAGMNLHELGIRYISGEENPSYKKEK